jgi:hypothetical protein
MTHAIDPVIRIAGAALVLSVLLPAGLAQAQNVPDAPAQGRPQAGAEAPPESEDGRYTFNRAGENYLRLDTRSGQVSLCSRRAVGWACTAVPDERAVLEGEIARLQTENGALKRELLARNLPLPEGVRTDPPAAKDEQPKLRMPTNDDVKTVVSFLERMWRQLVDAMTGLQNDIMRKS